MSNNWRKGVVFVLLGFFVTTVFAANNKQVFHRSFWQPNYHGQRLAYCTLDGQKCGLAVANRYCNMMGYARSDRQIIANNVGLTNYLDVNARCTGWRCNGFKTIRCRDKISSKPPRAYHYRLRRFVFPRFDNYRVDWCYDGKTGCGRKPAYSFCRRMGYKTVKRYSIQKHISATKAIGNQKLCFGPTCNAFEKIDCFR